LGDEIHTEPAKEAVSKAEKAKQKAAADYRQSIKNVEQQELEDLKNAEKKVINANNVKEAIAIANLLQKVQDELANKQQADPPFSPSQSPIPPVCKINNGSGYLTIHNGNRGECLSVSLLGGGNQKFSIEPAGDGRWLGVRMIAYGGNLCIGPREGSTDAGKDIIQWTEREVDNREAGESRHWLFEPVNGGVKIVNVHSCLALTVSEKGLVQLPYKGEANQIWTVSQ
jgi:hypothetical protein